VCSEPRFRRRNTWRLLCKRVLTTVLTALLLGVPDGMLSSCNGFHAAIYTLGLFAYEGRYVTIEGYSFVVHHDHFGYYVVFRGVDYHITFDGDGHVIAPLTLILLLGAL